MGTLTRFGVSMDSDLLGKFDAFLLQKGYAKRSEAIRDLIREILVKKEWTEGKEVAGSITLVFDHHKRELMNTLTDIQHDFHHLIISSQHIHLDHDNCLEIIVVKGKPEETKELTNKLRSTKGVKYGALSIATTGKGLV